MLKHKNKIFVGSAAVISIYAFTKLFTLPVSKSVDVTPQNVSVVTLNSVGKSKITGTATIEDVSGFAAIITKFDGLPDDEEIWPVYLRKGTCKNMGAVVHKLAVPDAGEAETNLEYNVATLKSQAPLVIEMEKSLKDKTVVACGEISK